MARILLGVSGGIAAYKTLEFTRLAIKAGHSVRVVQTPDSLNFVGKSSYEGITGAPVLIDQFETDPAGGVFPDQQRPDHDPISHLALAENADVFLIAPATANTIAKLAHGYADNMLSALALGCTKPIVVAPAMNNDMYLSAATTDNLATLKQRGITVLDPGTGELASKGEFGVGRLPEPPQLLEAVEAAIKQAFQPKSLDGVNFLVTAGGTREPIDSVRFVGNRSSGKMGFAVAAAAAARGAKVTVIAANVSLPRDPAINYVDVATAAEMEKAVDRHFPQADALVMAAAVADFRPVDPADGKIKKAGRTEMTIELEATNDILAGIGRSKRADQVLIGFAAETAETIEAEAGRKLRDKNLDMIVANDISDSSIGFEVDQNRVSIVTESGSEGPLAGSKQEVAAAIVDRVERIVLGRTRSGAAQV